MGVLRWLGWGRWSTPPTGMLSYRKQKGNGGKCYAAWNRRGYKTGLLLCSMAWRMILMGAKPWRMKSS